MLVFHNKFALKFWHLLHYISAGILPAKSVSDTMQNLFLIDLANVSAKDCARHLYNNDLNISFSLSSTLTINATASRHAMRMSVRIRGFCARGA